MRDSLLLVAFVIAIVTTYQLGKVIGATIAIRRIENANG
jgi:hypothetical protein